MQRLTANDPETKSPDLAAANVAALRALFPELVTEGPDSVAVNLDVLKQLVGDRTVTDAEEKYGLNWHGKRRARQLALTPSTGTLRPCPEDSVDWDTTQNLMIEGDNLEVLKLLEKSYAGKVKLIYIDPPYNTGKDFVYPDNFQDNIRNYLELTAQIDSDGNRIDSNTEASGRFHTNWLNMMLPRLHLARRLMRDDGVMFTSIGESELQNLICLSDHVFGSDCAVGVACRVAKKSNNKGGLRLAGDSTIDTGMEWAWNVEVRATPRFPLAGVASCAGGRGGCTVTHAAAGSRGRGTCVGCPGTKGKVCWLRRPATVGSTRPGHRAAAPWVSTSRHFTRRGGQPPVRGRASAR